MQVREVYPGSSPNPDSEYVELQMWAEGQNLVGGHVLRTYDAAGGGHRHRHLPGRRRPTAPTRARCVLATPEAEARIRVLADAPIASAGPARPDRRRASAGKTSTASPGAASAARCPAPRAPRGARGHPRTFRVRARDD